MRIYRLCFVCIPLFSTSGSGPPSSFSPGPEAPPFHVLPFLLTSRLARFLKRSRYFLDNEQDFFLSTHGFFRFFFFLSPFLQFTFSQTKSPFSPVPLFCLCCRSRTTSCSRYGSDFYTCLSAQLDPLLLLLFIFTINEHGRSRRAPSPTRTMRLYPFSKLPPSLFSGSFLEVLDTVTACGRAYLF